MKMKKLCMAMGFVAGLLLACGATSTTWNGGDGNWGDPTKWSNGVPSSETPGEIHFTTTGEPYTVTLDRDVVSTGFFVDSPAGGVATASVTLAGSGIVTNTGAGVTYPFDIAADANFILDGPTMQVGGNANIRGEFEIKSGGYSQIGTLYTTRSSSLVRVSGGRCYVSRFKLGDNADASYEQTGGFAWFQQFETVVGNRVSITGGTIRRGSLAIPIGSADYRGVTNIVNDLSFQGGTTSDQIANYCGSYAVIGQKITRSASAASYAGFPLGITFGSCADWTLAKALNLTVREYLHVDTSDFFDPAVSHTADMTFTKGLNNAPFPFDFAVYGGGAFTFILNDMDILPPKFDAFTLGDGTTMNMVRSEATYHRANTIFSQRLKLGAGSVLSMMMRYNYLDATDTAEIGDGATLNMHIYSAESESPAGNHDYGYGRYPAIVAGPTGSVESVTVNLTGDGTAGWTVRKLLNCAWVDDGTTDMTPNASSSSEWCGGSGGNLSTAANWSKGSAPDLTTGGNSVSFKTMQGVVTNDVDNASLRQINVAASCGPVLMRGKPISAAAPFSRSSASAIRNVGMFPLVFENDVVGPASCANFNVMACGSFQKISTYVAFMGKLTVESPVFDVVGHVLIGGEATANSIWMNAKYSEGRNSMLEVLSGGSMTVSSQSNAFDKASCTSLRVNEGGVLSFTGGTFDNRTASKHRVFGLMDIDVPLASTAALSFAGSGRVYVASTRSSATATPVKIGEGLRLCPKSWDTVTSDGVAPITIYAETRATIGAKADWTYGPAAGVSTATTPVQRALVTEDIYAPLTIDTTDPDTGVGHTITFADPILAAGDVEVKGAGAVCFASGEDSFGGKLSFDGQVTLALSDAQHRAALDGWADILTAAKIEGLPRAAEGVKMQVVDNGDGTQSLRLRISGGFKFLIR